MNNNITKRIHINPQSKGSLGKSFEAEFRTAWLDYHDIHWNGSDLDDRHHSFADRHPEQVQSYVLGNDDDSKSTLLGLFRNVSRSDAPVHIVDCRAQADGLIVQALESLQLLESLATQGIRFTFFLFPSEDTESMNNLLDLFYFAGDRVDYVIVHNPAKVRTSHPDAARLSNILNKNVNTCFAQQAEPSSGDVSALAAESYHEAGTVLYTMGRFEEAVKMVEKAVKCQPGEGKYYFFIAKYLTRLGKPDSAVPQLQKAIELVPEIALATIGDFDLNRSQITLDLLETLNNSVNSQLTCGIQRLEKWSEANSRAGDTDVPEWITSARESLKEGTYSQKRELLAKLANYDDAMLAILPAYSKIMAFFNDAFIGQKRIKARLAKAVETQTKSNRQTRKTAVCV